MTARPIAACDCETDPFLINRVPKPFIWGYYDGRKQRYFSSTKAFVDFVKNKRIILFAHNGGKFDFVFLMEYVAKESGGVVKVQLINGRIVSMMLGECELRDSYAIMPVPLRELGAKKDIEYWKLEKEVRDDHMDEIRDYLFYDCAVLYDAVIAYRDTAGKGKTIAGNALSFARRIGIDPGKTNHRFDAEYRRFYFGGRTQCFQPGEHKNLVMLDIHSAYPFAMMHDHATGSEFVWRDDLKGMSREEIQRSFIIVDCFANSCFPIRNGVNGLEFPKARGRYCVTGWEFLTASDLGLVENVEFVSVRSTTKTINFDAYVKHWYAEKLKFSAKDANGERIEKALYTIAKTMMNSLYGKLAQNPLRYFDYKIVKAGTKLPCPNPLPFRIHHCKNCDFRLTDHGWTLAQEYAEFEIHRRSSMYKYTFQHGEEWVAKPLYKNVATGASVTGFVRSHLLRAMHLVGMDKVVYCDTDSIIALPGANFNALPLTEHIGAWELEDKAAPVGYFAGKKLYAIEMSAIDKKSGKNKQKIASKGSKLTLAQVRDISRGATVTWENEAPTFNFLGAINKKDKRQNSVDDNAKFVVRSIRKTA